MRDFGVVAIGRNEGDRLRGCLASFQGLDLPLVYVDSGSTDGSVALARSMGVDVVELDMTRPFSAARARNAGFERLRTIAPGLARVMFLDGDCEVAEGWIESAFEEMDGRPDAAVVCGRRREKHPERTIYNRLTDIEWDTPIGRALSSGGDAVMRVDAFEAVGGFDPTVPACEEPELCRRLRKAGWSIWRIDAEMTRHDLAMTRFSQWWRRAYRFGHSSQALAVRFPDEEPLFVRERARARFWAVAWPIAVAVGGGAALIVVGPLVAAGVAVVLLGLPVLQALRLALKIRGRVDGWRTALAYGVLNMAGQFACAAGQFGYLRDRRLGRSAGLIEYKAAEEPGPTPLTSAPAS